MIRKQKLAIVVVGALLLVGVAFGAPRPSKPIILWIQDGFVCTNKVGETDSLETRKYNANMEERAQLRERKYILQQDINISESTCDTLPRKQQAACRRGVNELKSIEKRLDQINLFASRYYSCINNDIAWSHPVTRLSFSPYRSHDIKTIVPGEFSILGDWSVSTNKGTATISYLGFQMVDNTHGTACDIFGEYELRDGMDKVISIGKVSDGMVRFDLTPTFIASTKSKTLRLIGKGAPTRGEGHFDPKICVMEMRPTDYARSRIETEGDNSGFGPYGYLYEVLSSIVQCPNYSLPVCLEGQEIVSGGIGADGCPLPSVCKDTYSWMIGVWGACSNNIQARSVTCQDNFLGSIVANYYCSGAQPAVSQSCDGVADPLCTLFPELCI